MRSWNFYECRELTNVNVAAKQKPYISSVYFINILKRLLRRAHRSNYPFFHMQITMSREITTRRMIKDDTLNDHFYSYTRCIIKSSLLYLKTLIQSFFPSRAGVFLHNLSRRGVIMIYEKISHMISQTFSRIP